MDMVYALTEALDMYCRLNDQSLESEEKAREPITKAFFNGNAVEYALKAEAIDKAIDFIESHGLFDKAATLRYKALELANERIISLEGELAKLNPPVEHESELYRSDVGY